MARDALRLPRPGHAVRLLREVRRRKARGDGPAAALAPRRVRVLVGLRAELEVGASDVFLQVGHLLLFFLELVYVPLAVGAISSLPIQRHKLIDNFSLAVSCREIAHLVCVLAAFKFLLFQIVLIHGWVYWDKFCYLARWPF